jgi:hypothetical protein
MINKNCETREALWVPETRRTLCDLLILVEQPSGRVRGRGAAGGASVSNAETTRQDRV